MDHHFYIAGYPEPLTGSHPLWTRPLPVSTRHFGVPAESAPIVTHGDYFLAVGDYLRGAGVSHLAAAGLHPEDQGAPAVRVVLEKHGAFYHPARLVLDTAGGERWLALNVAVTPVGLELMESEVAAFAQVAPRLPPGALPRLYGQAAIGGPGGLSFGMFLAEWLTGFHEFHLSRRPSCSELGIRLWDPQSPDTFLNSHQHADLYRQAAELLARAYDPDTTAQIYPWHHAAGDFVARIDAAGVRLKLISVRQYAPTLTETTGAGPDPQGQRLALQVFFLNTTLRLRIDRLEGTGPLVWAAAAAVPAAVQGVFNGLADPWRQALAASLAVYDRSDYHELLNAVAERYCLMPGESDLLVRELDAHAGELVSAVADIFNA